MPKENIPTEALKLLHETALGDTHGSRAARNILFWMVRWYGGLELRALDSERRQAALEILIWWSGMPYSHRPLESIIEDLREKGFEPALTTNGDFRR